MRHGKQIIITESAVQAVLDMLVFSTSKKPDVVPLQYLFIVERSILNPSTPATEKQRLYTIQSLLLDLITDNIIHVRSRFGYKTIDKESKLNAIDSISRDIQTGSFDLIGWSILYYVYVQVDLGLSIDDIADIIGIAPRTARRYRIHGIGNLTRVLWAVESECRQAYWYRTIEQQLEPFVTPYFEGRNIEVGQVLDQIDSFKEFYVYGAKGIGKTGFLAQVITQIVQTNPIDDLLWIQKANDIDATLLQIQQHFVQHNPDVDLKSIFSAFECVVVLEDVDNLLKSNQFSTILNTLRGAYVFFSSQYYYSTSSSTSCISLQRLDENYVKHIIHKISQNQLRDETVKQISSQSDGNLEMVYHLTHYHYDSIYSQYQNTITGLKLEERLILCLIPTKDGLDYNSVFELSQTLNISESRLDFLVQENLIKVEDSRVYCQVESHILAKSLHLSDLLQHQIPQLLSIQEVWLIAGHLLSEFSDFIEASIKNLLIERFWKLGLLHGNKVMWYQQILGLTDSEQLWVKLAQAVAHKAMNKLDIAENLLLEVINLSGLKGDFKTQAEAVLEIAKVYRLKSAYKQAEHYLNLANSTLKAYFTPELFKTVVLEQSQLALDKNQIKYALALSNSIESIQALMIRAEVLYRLTDYDQCIEICNTLITDYALSGIFRGIVHNLLGRCYQLTNLEFALEQFDLATAYFTNMFALRPLSRTHINLATIFIQLNEFDTAIQHLNDAQEMCKITSDRVGEKIIDKNRDYIRRLIALRY